MRNNTRSWVIPLDDAGCYAWKTVQTLQLNVLPTVHRCSGMTFSRSSEANKRNKYISHVFVYVYTYIYRYNITQSFQSHDTGCLLGHGAAHQTSVRDRLRQETLSSPGAAVGKSITRTGLRNFYHKFGWERLSEMFLAHTFHVQDGLQGTKKGVSSVTAFLCSPAVCLELLRPT